VTTFPSVRRGFAASAVGHKIYVFGGKTGASDLETWDAFDVSTGQWDSQVPGADQKRFRMPMDCLYGSAIRLKQ
jgi:hypothetical protein